MGNQEIIKSSSGVVGLLVVLGLCIYQLSCLAVIFFTPASEGQGDYYDATLDAEGRGSIMGVLFILIPLLLLFYPWFKQFFALIRNSLRTDYYGLFIAKGKVARLISILLTILNIGTIIWFTWNVSVEADRISNWRYEYALCSDNGLFYIGAILRVIAFWGTVHLAHGIYHRIVLRKQI